MSYIYHSFPSQEAANEFASDANETYPCYGLSYYETQEAADRHDPFPFLLTPPIVHIDPRSTLERLLDLSGGERLCGAEQELETLARKHGGRYAGT